MRDMIYRYLRYGCSYEYPEIKPVNIIDATFEDVKNELHNKMEKSILKLDNPESSVFQLSGGFDSSVIVSYFNNIKTFCTGRPGSIDKGYAEQVSEHFNTTHEWRGYNDLLKGVDFKKAAIEMSKINSHPRSFRNDFGLYSFLKYIKDHAECVVSGKGIEFQLLGYFTIFNKILELAIANGDYDINSAKEYLKYRTQKCPKDSSPLNMIRILKLKKEKPKYNLDMVQWWPSVFTKEETYELMNYEGYNPEFDSVYDICNFITDWFGVEYVDNRMSDYFTYFNMKSHNPYTDPSVLEFTRSIPIEMKKCMAYHKYVFYQAMAHRVPDYVIERPKQGLNTPPVFYLENKASILELVGIYLRFNTLKIFKYLDFDVVQKHLKDLNINFENKFRMAWALISLSIWLEEND